MKNLFVISLLFVSNILLANGDTIETKIRQIKYCKPRIIGMSPNKIISFSWDNEFAQTLKSTSLGSFENKEKVEYVENSSYSKVSGMRFNAKIPIINREKIIWQVGLNYARANYHKRDHESPIFSHKFGGELTKLTTSGLNSSIFKPLNNKSFLIVYASADLNGDYYLVDGQPLKYLRYSAMALYGKRIHDRKQWGLGFSRGYNAGQLTFLPVFMFNYTAPNNKWGAEIFLPARAWYRYTVNKSNVLRAGFELEGASYHLNNINTDVQNKELRRGQLRTKVEYQAKIYKSIWFSVQTGYSYVLGFNMDESAANGKDFSREFDANRHFVMINKLSNFMFINVALNIVIL